jgi:AraC-like DNA-binding protein
VQVDLQPFEFDPVAVRIERNAVAQAGCQCIECFNRPPMDYLRDVRLRRAAQLLRCGDLSVDEVARKVGFPSRSHFSLTFRDHFGASPLAFREGPAPSP